MSSPDFSTCCSSAQVKTNPSHGVWIWAAPSLEESGRTLGSLPSMGWTAGGSR